MFAASVSMLSDSAIASWATYTFNPTSTKNADEKGSEKRLLDSGGLSARVHIGKVRPRFAPTTH